MRKLSPRPADLPRTTARKAKNTVSARLEGVAKVARSVAAIAVVATPLVLAGVNLLVERYLAVFDQPGLSSFGDVAGLLTAILPTVLLTLIGLGAFAVLPLIPRWTARTTGDHSFTGAFGWPSPAKLGFGAAAASYARLHAPTLATSAVLVTTMLLHKTLTS